MNKRISKIINSLVGLSVLAMFAVAIVAGQARANLQNNATLKADAQRSTHIHIILTLENVQNLDVIPVLVKTVLDLPSHITFESKQASLR